MWAWEGPTTGLGRCIGESKYINGTCARWWLSLLNPLTAAYFLCTIRPMKSTYPTMQRVADGDGVERVLRPPETQSLRRRRKKRRFLPSRWRRQALKNA